MFLVDRTPRKTDTIGGHKRTTGDAGIAITGVFRELDLEQWKWRTLDNPFGFLVFKPSGVRFAEVSFRNYLVNIRWYSRVWLELGLGLYLYGLCNMYSWGCS